MSVNISLIFKNIRFHLGAKTEMKRRTIKMVKQLINCFNFYFASICEKIKIQKINKINQKLQNFSDFLLTLVF